MSIEDLKEDIKEIKELLLIQNNKNDKFLERIVMAEQITGNNKTEIKNLKGVMFKIITPILTILTIIGGILSFIIK